METTALMWSDVPGRDSVSKTLVGRSVTGWSLKGKGAAESIFLGLSGGVEEDVKVIISGTGSRL